MSRIIGPLIVAISGVVMCIWSWGTWPDPVIDFGREIYVPWRLAEGEVLYRDIVSYFNGPLSPYTHALLFKIFGPSLRVLVIFNLVVIAGLAAMLYWLMRQMAGDLAATVVGVAFFVLFAFAQLMWTGNFNYVCPYSYELPHGITLTAGAFCLFWLWVQSEKLRWLIAAGLLLGMVFLTKAEVFFAAVAAVVSGMVAWWWVERARLGRALRQMSLLLGGMLVAPLIAGAWFSAAMSPQQALRGILGAWMWVNDRELHNLPYFKELMGTADPIHSIKLILISGFAYCAVLVPAILVGLAFDARQSIRGRIGVVCFLVAGGAGAIYWKNINWNLFAQPLQVGMFICLVGVLWLLIRQRRDRNSARRMILPLVMVVWAGAMLAKIVLNVHIHHYGFALAMPATLVAVAALVGWGPELIDRAGGNGLALRGAMLGALLVSLYAHVRGMDRIFSTKTHTVAAAGDGLRADARATAVNALLDELARHPDVTLVVLPEGLLINYLARKVNPTGQLNFTPPALIMYGESAMLAAFERRPPDLIAVLNLRAGEYGRGYFGQDYARELSAWIQSNYQPLRTIESAPWHGHILKLDLMRRARPD